MVNKEIFSVEKIYGHFCVNRIDLFLIIVRKLVVATIAVYGLLHVQTWHRYGLDKVQLGMSTSWF